MQASEIIYHCFIQDKPLVMQQLTQEDKNYFSVCFDFLVNIYTIIKYSFISVKCQIAVSL